MSSGTERRKVLVIDDDALVAGALQRLLEQDYQVATVDSVEAALDRVQNEAFDVVVTDLQMPGKSGLDFIKTVHPEQRQLPIMLLTGHHTTDTEIEAIKLGAFDYVLKPISSQNEIQDFLALVAKAVATRIAASAPAAETVPNPPASTMIGRSRAMQEVY